MPYNKDVLIDELSLLCEQIFGEKPSSIIKLPQSGGYRKYYRIVCEWGECIGTIGNSVSENERFLRFSELLKDAGANVPRILGVGESRLTYLQTDLGNISLFDLILKDKKGTVNVSDNERMILTSDHLNGNLYVKNKIKEAFRQLVLTQRCLKNHVNTDFRRHILWDLNYFKYEFLKIVGIDFDENALENDFEKFADRIMSIPREFWGFVYRDFQSRNVMIYEDEPYLIDYQGGMSGPVLYDAISFLYQAKAGFSKTFRNEMLTEYAELYADSSSKSADAIRMLDDLIPLCLLRTLQVLGAYGLRGLVEKRAHFIDSIKGALINLEEILENYICNEYPELKRVCKECVSSSKFESDIISGRLTVEIYSFSYKRGYPENLTGNGGGFMFDCRALHNPGRYDKYKSLTGLDRPVIDFLEDRGEVQQFLNGVESIVIPAIDRYSKRNFTHIQIGFGCTGGQHRSVYCAEHLAQKIKDLFPDVRIIINHREQGLKKEL